MLRRGASTAGGRDPLAPHGVVAGVAASHRRCAALPGEAERRAPTRAGSGATRRAACAVALALRAWSPMAAGRARAQRPSRRARDARGLRLEASSAHGAPREARRALASAWARRERGVVDAARLDCDPIASCDARRGAGGEGRCGAPDGASLDDAGSASTDRPDAAPRAAGAQCDERTWTRCEPLVQLRAPESRPPSAPRRGRAGAFRAPSPASRKSRDAPRGGSRASHLRTRRRGGDARSDSRLKIARARGARRGVARKARGYVERRARAHAAATAANS